MGIFDAIFGISEVDQKAIEIFNKAMNGTLTFEEAKDMVSSGRATKEEIKSLALGGKVPEGIIDTVLKYM